MAETARIYTNIYLCEIAQPHTGFAEFGAIYKRKSGGTQNEALDDILKNRPDWTNQTDWKNVTSAHGAGGLDLKFNSSEGTGLVFVTIPIGSVTGSKTLFGVKGVVDLDVRGPRGHKVVSNVTSHHDENRLYSICSFEIDLAATRGRFNQRPGQQSALRFPIMFDFVDTIDGVSPAFKPPHEHAFLIKTMVNDVEMLTHGGIHPPSASSVISIDP
jgi:hypothetical protein